MKKIPTFKNEQEESRFWATHDSSEYMDWNKSTLAYFPKLEPSTKTISIRLPEHLLNDIKILAHRADVPYQSLMKIFLSQGVSSFRNES